MTVVGGRWRIDALLNNGPMSSVHAATDLQSSRRVALKILHPELTVDDGMRRRFQREGYAANAVDHPGVVSVFAEAVTDDGAPVLVMELLDGESLETVWRNSGGRMAVADVVEIARDLLDVLSAAHARGVVHRDLKPANVFLTRSGALKILDFGLAWESGRSGSVTGIGVVMGTPAFMPPEQALARREEIDARTDLWSLGATLFTLLSGRAVHEVGSPHAQIVASATEPAPLLRSVAPDVPAAIAAVIDRALAFEKRDRWEDADAMRDALRLALTSAPTAALLLPRAAVARVALVSIPEPAPSSADGAETLVATEEVARIAKSIVPNVVPPPPSVRVDVRVADAPVDSLVPAQRSVRPTTARARSMSPMVVGLIAAGATFALTLGGLVVGARALRGAAAGAPASAIEAMPPIAATPLTSAALPPLLIPPAPAETSEPRAIASASASPSVKAAPPRWLVDQMKDGSPALPPLPQPEPPDTDER